MSNQIFGNVLAQLAAQRGVYEGELSDNFYTYDIDGVVDKAKSSPIVEVLVVCTWMEHEVGGSARVSYHWRLFLVLGNNSSVEVQTYLLSTTTGMCKIICTSRSYRCTERNLVCNISMTPAVNWTVQQVFNYLFVDLKRHRYQFDIKKGSGCLFWCETVAEDLERAGMLPSGTAADLDRQAENAAKRDPENMPRPPVQGTFH